MKSRNSSRTVIVHDTYVMVTGEDRLSPLRLSIWENWHAFILGSHGLSTNAAFHLSWEEVGLSNLTKLPVLKAFTLVWDKKPTSSKNTSPWNRGNRFLLSCSLHTWNLLWTKEGSFAVTEGWGIPSVSKGNYHTVKLLSDHQVTRLLIKHHHEKAYHLGTNHMLSKLSARYWLHLSQRSYKICRERLCSVQKKESQTSTAINGSNAKTWLNNESVHPCLGGLWWSIHRQTIPLSIQVSMCHVSIGKGRPFRSSSQP